MYSNVIGDLLAVENNLDYIAHGCNCQGIMASGIAKPIRARYGEAMHDDYMRLCESGRFGLGSAYVWPDDHYPNLINLGTQPRPGKFAQYDAVLRALVDMCDQVVNYTYAPRIGLPRIGCGIGGLNWEWVNLSIAVVSNAYPTVDLIVYTLP